MCVSCGCGKSNDAHSDMRNITMDDVNRAAEAAGITPDQAAHNISESCQRGSGKMQGQGMQGQQSQQGMGNMGNTGRRGYEAQGEMDRF